MGLFGIGQSQAKREDSLRDVEAPQNGRENFKSAIGPDITIAVKDGRHIITWEHHAPGGTCGTVQFAVRPDGNKDIAAQIESMRALYERDYIREDASNPLITAFFKGMLARADVSLLSMKNCEAKNIMFCSHDPNITMTFENVRLKNCVIDIEARSVVMQAVEASGASSVQIKATESSMKSFKIADGSSFSGSLGKCTFDEECEVRCRSVGMDFRQAHWLEVAGKRCVKDRTGGIIVQMSLVTPEFAKQANLQPMTPEQDAQSVREVRSNLDGRWA